MAGKAALAFLLAESPPMVEDSKHAVRAAR
ncbi:hypothetical protein ACVWZ4_006735 [Bradyrhizobium sp. USDA 4472]